MQSLGEHKELGCAALVKEFFANLVDTEEKKVYFMSHPQPSPRQMKEA